MVVLTMTNSPPCLSGDLSKWMQEIDTCVYVGMLNSRVRDALWQRVCNNIGSGKAVMVFSTNNEQRMGFYFHNSDRTVMDFDGLLLVKNPLPKEKPKKTIQTESILPIAKPKTSGAKSADSKAVQIPQNYVILDLETTGLNSDIDEIIEIGSVKVEDGVITDEYSQFIRIEGEIPEFISQLTGIDNGTLNEKGIPLSSSLTSFVDFVGSNTIVCFNTKFDKSFLYSSAQRININIPNFRFLDARLAIKRIMPGLANYKLLSIAQALNVSSGQTHRAANDCKLLFEVISKLKENGLFSK